MAIDPQPAIAIAAETPDQPDVVGLLQAADARSASLYPTESRHGASVETLLAQKASFVVVRQGGRAVGCGGFVADSATDGELKRIFVAEAMRGTGLGRLILTTLEDAARANRIQFMRLETGIQSVEAIGLYKKAGYSERGPFGPYRADPLSVFMEKALS